MFWRVLETEWQKEKHSPVWLAGRSGRTGSHGKGLGRIFSLCLAVSGNAG